MLKYAMFLQIRVYHDSIIFGEAACVRFLGLTITTILLIYIYKPNNNDGKFDLVASVIPISNIFYVYIKNIDTRKKKKKNN